MNRDCVMSRDDVAPDASSGVARSAIPTRTARRVTTQRADPGFPKPFLRIAGRGVRPCINCSDPHHIKEFRPKLCFLGIVGAPR